MSFLSKKRGPDIDFTLLQKKGLIKKGPERKLGVKVDKAGFIELANSVGNINGQSSASVQGTSSLGFLENMVETQASSASPTSENPLGGFFDNPSQFNPPQMPGGDERPNAGASADELNSLKVKLDDLEYKLGVLLDRIEKLESRG